MKLFFFHRWRVFERSETGGLVSSKRKIMSCLAVDNVRAYSLTSHASTALGGKRRGGPATDPSAGFLLSFAMPARQLDPKRERIAAKIFLLAPHSAALRWH